MNQKYQIERNTIFLTPYLLGFVYDLFKGEKSEKKKCKWNKKLEKKNLFQFSFLIFFLE